MQTTIAPTLSVVVVPALNTLQRPDEYDLSGLIEVLTLLQAQTRPPATEILVPWHEELGDIIALQARFPDIRFIRVGSLATLDDVARHDHHDMLRARAVAAARGQVIAMLEDTVLPDLSWASKVMEAHRQSYAVVGGAIENGINRPLHWASYLCDLGRYQNPLKGGPSAYASIVNVSYKRIALEKVRDTWQEQFNETRLHAALAACGEQISLFPDMIVHYHRPNLTTTIALQEFYIWGRSYAENRANPSSRVTRIARVALSPLLPLVLLGRIARRAASRGTVRPFITALPFTVLLLYAWCLGEFKGYITGYVQGER